MLSVNVCLVVLALLSFDLVEKSNAICCPASGEGLFKRKCPFFQSKCGGGSCVPVGECCGNGPCNIFCCNCDNGCKGSSGEYISFYNMPRACSLNRSPTSTMDL